MAVVSLKIGGRYYKFSCADGQESYMASLAESLDARAEKLLKDPCWSLPLPFSLLPHGSPARVIYESPLAHLLLLTWKAEAPRLSLSLPEDRACPLGGPLWQAGSYSPLST